MRTELWTTLGTVLGLAFQTSALVLEFENVTICSQVNNKWCVHVNPDADPSNRVWSDEMKTANDLDFIWDVVYSPDDSSLNMQHSETDLCAFHPDSHIIDVGQCSINSTMFKWFAEPLKGSSLALKKPFYIKSFDGLCVNVVVDPSNDQSGTKEFRFLDCPSSSSDANTKAAATWIMLDGSAVEQISTTAPTTSHTKSTNQFTEMLLLLGWSTGAQTDMLGLGVSSRDTNFTAVEGLPLQTKSYVRNAAKSDLHVQKMMWSFTSEGFLSPNNPAVVLYSPLVEYPQHPNHEMLTMMELEHLKAKVPDYRRHIKFTKKKMTQGFKLRLAETHRGVEFCITAMKCYARPNPTGASNHICLDRSAEPAETKDKDFLPGAFVKLYPCEPRYDLAQLFELVDPEFGDNIATFSPAVPPDEIEQTKFPTAKPTKQPLSAHPTHHPSVAPTEFPTKHPTSFPTEKPTDEELPETEKPTTTKAPTAAPTVKAKGGTNKQVTPEEKDSVENLSLALLLLLLSCLLIVLFLIFLNKRRRDQRRRRKLQENQRFLFHEDADDDDEQEFYSSFDNDGKYPHAFQRMGSSSDVSLHGTSSSGARSRSTRDEVLLEQDDAEPISQPTRRTTPHVTHFEQEQGFVARV